jgi:hypothetical protein
MPYALIIIGCIQFVQRLVVSVIANTIMEGFGLWCLPSLSTIFHLYRDGFDTFYLYKKNNVIPSGDLCFICTSPFDSPLALTTNFII